MEEESFTLLLKLPNEILQYILLNNVITYKDVCSFSSVCSSLRRISNDNELWKNKLGQRWPKALKHYACTCCGPRSIVNWKEEFIHLHWTSCFVQRQLAGMSARYHKLEEVSNSEFKAFSALLEDNEHLSYFVIDELMGVVHDNKSDDNLTLKYYAEKVVRFVRHTVLKKNLRKFLSLPVEEQILEKGAILIAQWCQPDQDIDEDDIVSQLDSIMNRSIDVLHEKNPNHPFFRHRDRVSQWKSRNIEGSQWTSSECRQIISAVCSVMYQEMGFHGNREQYFCPDNSYINKVLETRKGIPITLSVVFEAVARRLGVKCDPVIFPAHFLLRWTERDDSVPDDSRSYYIDLDEGRTNVTKRSCPRFSQGQCPASSRHPLPGAQPLVVLEHIARNLVVACRNNGYMGNRLLCLRNALELLLLINPLDLDSALHLARLYMHLSINLDEVIDRLQEIQPQDVRQDHISMQVLEVYEAQYQIQTRHKKETRKIEPKPRVHSGSCAIEFAVGMIMRHKRYNYTCVIYGWDAQCTASQEWIIRMGVDYLPKKDKQPFYNVLVEDGSNRYAAQENLEIAFEPKRIDHAEIGRYFSKFCGTHYLPNDEKATEYPEDAQVRERLLTNTL